MGRWRALLALLLFASAPAAAEERITSYITDVAIQKDSSLEVTETIKVLSEGDRIVHGIFRDFPTRYRGRHGNQMRVGFTFEGAERDGRSEPAKVEPLSNGVRIRIGSADTEIAPGEHRYVIRYRTTRQIGRFDGYDELYWNATGNGWIFPIDVAVARLTLPEPARFGERAAYTGPEGSTLHDAQVVSEGPGEITFQTTRALGPYQGLTVAAAFPKGVVSAPGPATRLGWWLADYGPPFVGAFGLIGLLGFYYFAWKRAGRDPKPGAIVPLFTPPDDLSPAGMRYVVKESADNRAFAAALVDMGVRGHIKIAETDGGWLSADTRTIERRYSPTPLSEEEDAALKQLVGVGDVIAMKQKNHAKFASAEKALNDVLQKKYENKLFKRNYGWAAAGLMLFLAAMWVTAAAVDLASGFVTGPQVAVPEGAALVAALLLIVQRGTSTVASCLLGLGAFAAFAVAVVMGAPLFIDALNAGWWFPLLLPALAVPVVISAFWWISAPTVEGRKVLDHIAGFKHYLSITERERLDRMTPPDDTPELFEKYLPYAIALGVENRWAERFAGVLAAAAVQGQQGFAWYSGSSSPWSDPEGFTNSVGSSLATTVSSASTAPGSGSGSGGGGSSGGGGGGGGGGGW